MITLPRDVARALGLSTQVVKASDAMSIALRLEAVASRLNQAAGRETTMGRKMVVWAQNLRASISAPPDRAQGGGYRDDSTKTRPPANDLDDLNTAIQTTTQEIATDGDDPNYAMYVAAAAAVAALALLVAGVVHVAGRSA